MADAEKILGTDTLRKAYPKLNNAIELVNNFQTQLNTKIDNSLFQRIHSLNSQQKIRKSVLYDLAPTNIHNPNTLTNGFYLGVNGTPVVNASGSITDYYPVKPNTTYYSDYVITATGGIAYDANLNMIGTLSGITSSGANGAGTFTTPANTFFVRLNIPTEQLHPKFIVAEGSVKPNFTEHNEGYINGLKINANNLNGVLGFEQMTKSSIVNLYSDSEATQNKYLNNLGEIKDSSILNMSRVIKVKPGDIVGSNFHYDTGGGYYSINGNWIKSLNLIETGTGTGWYTETVPIGCEFLVVNVVKNDLEKYILAKSSTKPKYNKGKTFEELLFPSKWKGKNVGFIGDSITEHNTRTNKNYHDFIAERNGMNVFNYGMSGTGYGIPYGSSPAIRDRITTITDSLDLIIVFAGTNDFGNGTLPLGTEYDTGSINLIDRYQELPDMMVGTTGGFSSFTGSSLMFNYIPVLAGETLNFSQTIDQGSTDNLLRYAYYDKAGLLVERRTNSATSWSETVPANAVTLRVSYPSLNTIILIRGVDSTTSAIYETFTKLAQTFPHIPIGIMTPLPRSEGNIRNKRTKTGGYSLEELVDRIKLIAGRFSFPVLDLFRYSNLPVWTQAGNEYYFTAPGNTQPDGLHPNDAGHKLISTAIGEFLERL